MRDPEIHTEGYYHIFNRGVDKRPIFLSEKDYQQFFEQMYLFNDANYYKNGDPLQKALLLSGNEVFSIDRDPFVEFFAYCLMPNHYHFFVKQNKGKGISLFLHKLNMAYSRIFNHQYHRTGTLFEGRFKAISVTKEEHFRFLPIYIHLNALDKHDHEWRTGKLKNWDKAVEFLDTFRWSSHGFYLGKTELYPLMNREATREFFKNSQEYLDELKSWATRLEDLQFFEDIFTG